MIGVYGEEFTPLDADHSSISKFESPSDQNLKLVQNSIKNMVDTVPYSEGKFQRSTKLPRLNV